MAAGSCLVTNIPESMLFSVQREKETHEDWMFVFGCYMTLAPDPDPWCRAGSDLWPVQADDAVDVARAVVEVGHGDGVFAAGNPVLLGVGVDLEDVRSGAEDGLLSVGHTHTHTHTQLQCMMG